MSHGPCYMPSSSKFQMANDIDGKWQMVGSHALGSRNGEGRMLKNVQNSDVVQRRVPSLIIPSCCFAKKTIIAKIMPAEIMIRQMKIYSTYLAHFLISAFQTSKSHFWSGTRSWCCPRYNMPIPSYKASILPQYYISESFPRIGWAIVKLDCCFTISKRMGHDGPWFSLSSNFEAQSFRSTSLHWWYFSSSHQPLLKGFVSPILT